MRSGVSGLSGSMIDYVELLLDRMNSHRKSGSSRFTRCLIGGVYPFGLES